MYHSASVNQHPGQPQQGFRTVADVQFVTLSPGVYVVAFMELAYPRRPGAQYDLPLIQASWGGAERFPGKVDFIGREIGPLAWLTKPGDSALFRVSSGPALVCLTIYRPEDMPLAGIRMRIFKPEQPDQALYQAFSHTGPQPAQPPYAPQPHAAGALHRECANTAAGAPMASASEPPSTPEPPAPISGFVPAAPDCYAPGPEAATPGRNVSATGYFAPLDSGHSEPVLPNACPAPPPGVQQGAAAAPEETAAAAAAPAPLPLANADGNAESADTAAPEVSLPPSGPEPEAPVQPGSALSRLKIIVRTRERGEDVYGAGTWTSRLEPGDSVTGLSFVAQDMDPMDMEYCALTPDGQTPWVWGGCFAEADEGQTPLTGFALRLKGLTQSGHDIVYYGAYPGDETSDELRNGEICEPAKAADTPLQAVFVVLMPR